MQRSSLILSIGLAALVAGVVVFLTRPPGDVRTIEMPVESSQVAAPELVQYPTFTLKDVDGVDHAFSEYDGRHRLLNFWATWCAPCRREIPVLKAFQAEQGDDGILIIGIAVDFAEEVARYAEAAEFNYPILVGEQDAMAVAESSGVEFMAMPFTMIVSRDGEFLSAYLGELHASHLNDISDILAQLDSGEIDTTTAKDALDVL